MASFLRGDIKIFEQWNDRFYAELGALINNNLNNLPNDGNYGPLPNVVINPRSRVPEVYEDYLNPFIFPVIEELNELLDGAQDIFFSSNSRTTLIQNYENLSREAKLNRPEKETEDEADI